MEVCPLDAMYKESEPWPEPVPHDPITLDGDLCVIGGVRVNENIQAYANDRETLIENLYVPGDFASGRFLNMHGYKVQIINDLFWAMSSGFIVGSHAAKLLKDQ